MLTSLRYPPFAILLAFGIIVRVSLMVAYYPAVMLMFDSPRYARAGGMAIFGDFWMPAGYPMLLQLLHAISHQLWFTIAVQHATGLAVGVFLFLAVQRLGVARSTACLPASVPLLSGDHLYLEHVVMADHFLIVLAVAGLSAAVCGLVPTLNLKWLSTGSACLAMAGLTRSTGVVLLPVLVLCTFLFVHGELRRRSAALAAAVLPGVGVYGLYVGAFFLAHGQYLGLADMRGWNLYSRVAPFADCQKFKPPQGTEILCEQRPPWKRPGPFGYVWDLNSVPRRSFPLGPETGAKLEAFSTQAILHQPLDYLRAIVVDLARYLDPAMGPVRPYAGQSRELLSFGWRDKSVENMVVRAMSRVYRGTKVRLQAQGLLAFYQNTFRVSGFAICVLLVMSAIGVLKAKGGIRLGVVLFGLSACGLYLLPVVTLCYQFRYGIPPETLLVVSGVLGAVSLWPQPTAIAESPDNPRLLQPPGAA